MTSSYIFSPVDNDSSGSCSPSQSPASPIGSLPKFLDEPLSESELDAVDDPLLQGDPGTGPDPSEYSSEGDLTDFEGDEAFSIASTPSGQVRASTAEDIEYQPSPLFGGASALPPATSLSPATPSVSSHTDAPYHPLEAQQATSARPQTPTNQLIALQGTQSTPVIAKPSATQKHSFKNPTVKHSISGIRKAYSMELRGRISQMSLDSFMAEFVPGPDIPPGTTFQTFDPPSFQREGQRMYNHLVSSCATRSSVVFTDCCCRARW